MNFDSNFKQVHFLHEDVVVDSVQRAVEDGLLGCNLSRTYYTQALLPTPVSLEGAAEGERNKRGSGSGGGRGGLCQGVFSQVAIKFTKFLYCIYLLLTEKPSYAYQMVRTDSKEQKLEAFVVPKSLQISASQPSTSELSGSYSNRVGERGAEVCGPPY